MVDKFIYGTLNTEEDPEIRLLRVHRPTNFPSDKPLICDLEVARLAGCGAYKALSYAWGDLNETVPILVNGQELQITLSLDLALRNIRHLMQDHSFLIWADAICINQKDKHDRNHQVRLMGQIYSKAECVYVWLGEEADDSPLAFVALEKWSKAFKSAPEIEGNKVFNIEEVPNPFDLREWKAIEKLIKRPWWRRLWTLQEISLSSHAHMICGQSWTSYTDFCYAVFSWSNLQNRVNFASLPTHGDVGAIIQNTRSEIPSVKVFTYMKQMPQEFLYVFERSFMLECSDPRDRVYGILGIVKDGTLVEIDYHKPVSDIYHNLTNLIISKEQRLDMLRFAGLKATSSRVTGSIPTWVANLDAGTEALKSVAQVPDRFDASAGNTAAIHFSDEGKALSITGTEVGRIIKYAESPTFWHIIDFFLQDHTIHYVTGIGKLDAIFRLIQRDLNHLGHYERLSRYDENFIQLSREFIIYVLFKIEVQKLSLNSDSDSLNPEFRKICDNQESLVYQMCFWLSYSKQVELLLILFYPDEATRPEFTFKGRVEDRLELTYHFFTIMDEEPHLSIFKTSEGHIGLGPKGMANGDIICVLMGYRLPVVLRDVGSGYQLVGDCYIQGLMDGEALKLVEEGKAEISTFRII